MSKNVKNSKMNDHAIQREFSYGKTKIDFFDPDFDGYISFFIFFF